MPDELISDEPTSNLLKNYEIHNRILDLTIESMKSRFEKHMVISTKILLVYLH